MKTFDIIVKYLFPPKCVFCRRVLEEDGVCDKCASSLPYRRPYEVSDTIMFVDKAFSCFHYEADVKSAVIRYKFGGLEKYSVDFSKYLADCIKENIDEGFDILSWVPLSKKRLKSRGYDQAKLLAEEVAARLGTRAIKTLIKSRDTAPQSRQSDAAKRTANVLGAYEISSGDVAGKRVLLIDDVLTTGSTLSECARVLKTAGASEVIVVTLAKTRQRKNI